LPWRGSCGEAFGHANHEVDSNFGGYRAPACQDTIGIRYLSLEGNAVGANGAKAISEVLMRSDNSLETLNFERNQICDWGAGWLAMVLRNHNVLHCLNCFENPIGNDGIEELRSACSTANASLVLGRPGSDEDPAVRDEGECCTTVYVSEASGDAQAPDTEKTSLATSSSGVEAFRRPSSASRRQALGTKQCRNSFDAASAKKNICSATSRDARARNVRGSHRSATRTSPWPAPRKALSRAHSSCLASEDLSALSKSTSAVLHTCMGTAQEGACGEEAGVALAPPSRWCRKPRVNDCNLDRRIAVAQGCGTKAIRGLRRSSSAPGRKHGMILGPVAASGMCSRG